MRFVIAAGTAVNWLRQGEYNLRAELRAEGAGPERTATALARREATLALLRRGATYEEYRAGPDADRELTPERWAFISRNHTADASADLRAMPRVPVLLLSGADDLNVDGAETESVYRELLAPGTLTVRRYPGTTHALVRTPVERSGWRLPLTALFAPRAPVPAGAPRRSAPLPRRCGPLTPAGPGRAGPAGAARPVPARPRGASSGDLACSLRW
ncbi:hypothetical protein GCM10020254_42350 [Streptomyces goshikiensis]